MTARQLLFDRPVPDGWRVLKVDQLKADEPSSCAAGPFGSNISSKYFVDEGVPVIRGSNLRDDLTRFVPEGFVFVSEERAKAYKGQHVRAGDLVFTCWGTIGQVGLIPANGPYPEYIISNKQLKLRPDKRIADPLFLFYYFACPEMVKHIQSIAIGAAVPGINLGILKKLDVTLPPLPVQRRIVSVLSAYDDMIENNTRRIVILEEMARSTYRECFVNYCFPGHEKTKLIDSPVGKIPEGWKPLRLGDLAKEVRRGVNPSGVDSETPYFGLEHLPRRSITLCEWGKAADVQSTKLAFKKGEILFGKIRPYFHKVGVAPVDGVCSSDAIVIVPHSQSAFGPVVCCVSSDDFIRHATQTSQGTKMPRANWDVLVKYPLPIPPDGLLNDFNKIIADVIATSRVLMLKNRNLRAARDLLLPKLISGQLNVEELDIDCGNDDVIQGSASKASVPFESQPIVSSRQSAGTPYKDDAAILCVLVDALQKANRPTTEFVVQKHAFALKHLRCLPINSQFVSQKAGPWSQELRRKALHAGDGSKWLHFDEESKSVTAGIRIAQGLEHGKKVLGDKYVEVATLVDDLIKFGDHGLERWMTVFKVVCDLRAAGTAITRTAIQKGIDNWPGKRDKPDFSEEKVETAIQGMMKQGWFTLS